MPELDELTIIINGPDCHLELPYEDALYRASICIDSSISDSDDVRAYLVSTGATLYFESDVLKLCIPCGFGIRETVTFHAASPSREQAVLRKLLSVADKMIALSEQLIALELGMRKMNAPVHYLTYSCDAFECSYPDTKQKLCNAIKESIRTAFAVYNPMLQVAGSVADVLTLFDKWPGYTVSGRVKFLSWLTGIMAACGLMFRRELCASPLYTIGGSYDFRLTFIDINRVGTAIEDPAADQSASEIAEVMLYFDEFSFYRRYIYH